MSVVAIIAALAIEQWHPVGERKNVQAALAAWATWLEQSFNGGERRQGMVAWLVAVLPWVAAAIVLHLVLESAHPLLALLFNVVVLYLTLGFRQFSHYFTDIQLAVKSGDMDRARLLLETVRHEEPLSKGPQGIERIPFGDLEAIVDHLAGLQGGGGGEAG